MDGSASLPSGGHLRRQPTSSSGLASPCSSSRDRLSPSGLYRAEYASLDATISRWPPGLRSRQPGGSGYALSPSRPGGSLGDEGVDVPLVRPSFAFPLDVEAEEVEPIGHVHDPGLGH
jgi:hypothetical protein